MNEVFYRHLGPITETMLSSFVPLSRSSNFIFFIFHFLHLILRLFICICLKYTNKDWIWTFHTHERKKFVKNTKLTVLRRHFNPACIAKPQNKGCNRTCMRFTLMSKWMHRENSGEEKTLEVNTRKSQKFTRQTTNRGESSRSPPGHTADHAAHSTSTKAHFPQINVQRWHLTGVNAVCDDNNTCVHSGDTIYLLS